MLNKPKPYRRRPSSRHHYTPQRRPHDLRPLFKLRWLVLLLFLIPLGMYIQTLDEQVRTQFEGNNWDLPAHVYASPLELYPSMELNAAMLNEELTELGYKQNENLQYAGEYYQQGEQFFIKTRAFDFWDEKQGSRLIRVRLQNNQLAQIADMDAKESVSLLRLEPRLIAKIYPRHNEDRILVKIDQLPPLLLKALIAMEDRHFYQHNGINFRSVMRAMLTNLRHMAWIEGGSTLTQQLVKNLFLTPERTISRKVPEALMAVLLELHYDKDQILEAYFNEVYQGQDGNHGIHGVGMGAWFHFNRPLEQLNLPELATLVAVIRGASMYDPRRNPESALKRRNLVLQKMQEQNMIDRATLLEAQATPLNVSDKQAQSIFPYPHFIDLVREQLHRDYKEKDLRSAGLKIFTTLNPFMQQKAEQALINRMQKLERENAKNKNKLEGALIVTNTRDGEVLALVGGRNPRYDGFNRALNAKRQIGSVIKPAIYLTALEQPNRYSLLSYLNDTPFEWQDKHTGEIWQPGNYTGKPHGRVLLCQALANSYNLATVHLGFKLGLEKVRETLRRMGIEREFKVYPSMLLGGVSMTPLEVTQMYQTIASHGYNSPLRAIREVLDHNGKPLNRYAIEIEKRFSESSIFVLNYALQQAIRKGTGRAVAKELLPDDVILAGKTGTTNDYKDSWFAGYGEDILTVSWLGRDDNHPIHLSGGDGAMKVWADFMQLAKPQSLSAQQPNDIYWRWGNSGFGRDKIPFISGNNNFILEDKNLAFKQRTEHVNN